MKKRLLKTTTLALAVAMSTACMGSFALTKKLYAWNDTVTGNKIINNVIFWGLNIIPVYEFAVFGDAVILNLIEFWTGSNLLADASDVDGAGDSRVAVVEGTDGTLLVTRGESTFRLIPDGENRIRIEKDGTFVGTAERSEAGIVATNVDGVIMANVDAADAADASAVVAELITH